MTCRRTWLAVLHQDIGDGVGGRGGDTSPLRLGRGLPLNPSIPVSVSRSLSGAKMPLGGRSRRSAASSTGSHGSLSASCADGRRSTDRLRCWSPARGIRGRDRRSSPTRSGRGPCGCGRRWRPQGWTTGRSACTTRCAVGLQVVPSIATLVSPVVSRRTSRARRGAGSSAPPRTRAGSWTPFLRRFGSTTRDALRAPSTMPLSGSRWVVASVTARGVAVSSSCRRRRTRFPRDRP